MVTCKLYGRMGNQMFQIAATIALALRNNDSYAIPAGSKKPDLWPRYFHFPRKLMHVKSIWQESSHSYTAIPYSDGLCLDGYFQSEKYFSDYRKEIIEAVGLHWAKWNGIVSVHVRRGDYVNLQEKHPPVTVEYLREAMATIENYPSVSPLNGEKPRSPFQFLFFSDDIEWCRRNFPGNWYSENRTELDDLMMMSCCEHNIIANSSFSWWGAWLNRNADKVVIAPKVWFGPKNAHLDTKNLIPDTWIKI